MAPENRRCSDCFVASGNHRPEKFGSMKCPCPNFLPRNAPGRLPYCRRVHTSQPHSPDSRWRHWGGLLIAAATGTPILSAPLLGLSKQAISLNVSIQNSPEENSKRSN